MDKYILRNKIYDIIRGYEDSLTDGCPFYFDKWI